VPFSRPERREGGGKKGAGKEGGLPQKRYVKAKRIRDVTMVYIVWQGGVVHGWVCDAAVVAFISTTIVTRNITISRFEYPPRPSKEKGERVEGLKGVWIERRKDERRDGKD